MFKYLLFMVWLQQQIETFRCFQIAFLYEVHNMKVDPLMQANIIFMQAIA